MMVTDPETRSTTLYPHTHTHILCSSAQPLWAGKRSEAQSERCERANPARADTGRHTHSRNQQQKGAHKLHGGQAATTHSGRARTKTEPRAPHRPSSSSSTDTGQRHTGMRVVRFCWTKYGQYSAERACVENVLQFCVLEHALLRGHATCNILFGTLFSMFDLSNKCLTGV